LTCDFLLSLWQLQTFLINLVYISPYLRLTLLASNLNHYFETLDKHPREINALYDIILKTTEMFYKVWNINPFCHSHWWCNLIFNSLSNKYSPL